MDSVEPGMSKIAETVLDGGLPTTVENGDELETREFGTTLPLFSNVLVDPEFDCEENKLAKVAETPSTSTPLLKRKYSSAKTALFDDEATEERFQKLLEVIKSAARLQQDISKKIHELHSKNIRECEGHQNKKVKSSSVASSSNGAGLKSRLRSNSTANEALRKTPSGLMVPIEQPLLLEGAALRKHQLEGLKWLQAMDVNVVNGILGDEMGLGKTLQVIAMICFLIELGFTGPYIILAPLSIVPVWIEQFKTFAPKVPTMCYTGDLTERSQLFPKIKTVHHIMEEIKSSPIVVCAQHLPIRDPFLEKITWRYMVIDEGHRLNNPETKLHKALLRWKTNSRCILTGTPLQNDTRDLWALMNFNMPKLFETLEPFDSWFSSREFTTGDKDAERRLLEKEKKTAIASHFREILAPFLLRRLKSEVDLNFPKKTEMILTCTMTDEQADLYSVSLHPEEHPEPEEMLVDVNGKRKRRSCVVNRTPSYVDHTDDELEEMGETSHKSEKENADSFDRSSSQELQDDSSRNTDTPKNLRRLAESQQIMTLRHIANHPQLLLKNKQYTPFSEELLQRSSKLVLLDAMLKILKRNNHKVLIFSFFTMVLDLIGELLDARGYTFCRIDGGCDLQSRKEQINDFTQREESFVFTMTTRTGGLGLNLVAADTVIFFDNDWNPHIDLQAEARCHRIGQSKPVAVYRLAVKDTIDIAMLLRAEGKQKISTLLLSQNSLYSNKLETRTKKYSLKKFKQLLQSKSQPLVEPKNGTFYTNEELEEVMDRS